MRVTGPGWTAARAGIAGLARKAGDRISAAAGGRARLQIIVVLAMVLGLNMADNGSISAIADQLKGALHINNTQFGLLFAVASYASALTTLPMGILADRISRRLILICVAPLWALVMAVSGAAHSYGFLLGCRVALGAVEAAAWPSIASLTGNYFPSKGRAGVYGLILAGELVGMGVGFFVSGEVSSLLDWHWSFYAMAVLTAPLALILWRYLPEPERGTQGWIDATAGGAHAAARPAPAGETKATDQMSTAQKKIERSGEQPRPELVLHDDPTGYSLWKTLRYCLRLPTYDLLISASALSYYYFVGFSSFVMAYYTKHYALAHATVSALVFVVGIGAIAGVVLGGHVSERVMDAGRFSARVVVPGVTLLLAVPFFAASVWTTNPWWGVPLLTCAVGLLAAATAPIDAARLDIMHPRMWGRAEGGRSAIRSTFEGSAPLLFGAVSIWLGGGQGGLMWTFLLMLIAPVLGGSLALVAHRTYARDVATAAASIEAMAGRSRQAGPQ